jgi:hypothetical protein
MAPVISFAEKRAEKGTRVIISTTPALSGEKLQVPKPRNTNRIQKLFYGVGKFVLTIPESTHLKRGSLEEVRQRQAERDAVIEGQPAYKIRRWGAVTLALGLATAAAGGYIGSQVKDFPVQIGDPTCEFSTDTTIVTRKPGESNQALAVIYTQGVNWNQGNVAAETQINAINPQLTGWVGEKVALPKAYICE